MINFQHRRTVFVQFNPLKSSISYQYIDQYQIVNHDIVVVNDPMDPVRIMYLLLEPTNVQKCAFTWFPSANEVHDISYFQRDSFDDFVVAERYDPYV